MAKGKIKTAIGIELTGDRINLVQLAKTVEGIVLAAARSIKLPIDKREDDKKILVDNIIKVFEGLDYTKDGISLGVGGHVSFVRKVKLPPVSHSKLKQVISFEVQQQVPFSLNEVIWDYQITSPISKTPAPIVVLIAAIKQSFVEDLLKVLKESVNKIPDVVDTSALALHNCLVFNGLLPKEKVGILINSGFSYTDVSIENNGEIAFTRAVPIGRKNILKKIAESKGIEIEKAEELLDRQPVGEDISPAILSVWEDLIAEIKRTTNYYLSQIEKVTHFQYIYISGNFPRNSNLLDLLKNSFKVEVKEINPFEKIGRRSDILTHDACNFCVSVGLALRLLERSPVEINLLPPQVLGKKKMEGKRLYFVASLAALFIIGLLMLSLTARSSKFIQAKSNILKPILSSYQPLASQIEQLKKDRQNITSKIESITDILKQKSRLSEILLEISELTPTSIYITEISTPTFTSISGTETRERGMPPRGMAPPMRAVPTMPEITEEDMFSDEAGRRNTGRDPRTVDAQSQPTVTDSAASTNRIILKGVTASYPTVDEYIKQLGTSALFETVTLSSVTSTSETAASGRTTMSAATVRGARTTTQPMVESAGQKEEVVFELGIELAK